MQPVTTEAGAAAERTVTRDPRQYRARAWWGERLLAETTAAARAREEGQEPVLYFPRADVRFEALHDEGHRAECPVKGRATLWTVEGRAPRTSSGWHDPAGYGPDAREVDGRDAAWTFEPASGLGWLGWLSDLVAFDHDRVRVEIIDGAEGDEPRDVTSTRFPNWGDAADLIDIMNVRPDGERRYVSAALSDGRRPVVEGSQMLGQAIVAAGRHAPGRRAVSAHMVFHRAADARLPLEFDLEEISSGRTFTTLGVHVSQAGRRRASGTLLLDVTTPDLIRHADAPPPAPGPYESEPYDMGVTGRDIRMVDAAYTDDPNAPVGPPVIDTWVRFREVPADLYLHAGLLAQFTGHVSIAAAMRPHAGVSQAEAHRTLSTGINAIGIALHADVRADRWMRYHHRSTFAGAGMTHAVCGVYTEAGEPLASFTVDGMVRAMAGSGRAADDRVAM
jgi:acyl-CoA thioesterase/uncharacterized protein (DUF427 family)